MKLILCEASRRKAAPHSPASMNSMNSMTACAGSDSDGDSHKPIHASDGHTRLSSRRRWVRPAA